MLNISEQIFKQIKAARSILVVFPINWENDEVFASLALYSSLKKLGKTVEIVAQKPNKNLDNFAFIPEIKEIKFSLEHLRRFIVSLDISKTKVSQIKYVVDENKLNFIVSPADGWFESKDVSSRAGEFKHDLIMVIGANDLESLGTIYDQNIEFFYKTPIINISCEATTEEFGQINLININHAAVSELIFKLIKTWPENIVNEYIATLILAGIIAKTKNFKINNLNPETLLLTSELISLGAKREEIINRFYRSRQIDDLKVWGKILNNLRLEMAGKLIVSHIKLTDLEIKSVNEETLEDIIEELIINLPNALVAVILIENPNNQTTLYLYSLKNINILELANKYKLLGNIKSATFTLKKNLSMADQEITEYLKNQLDKLR